MANSARWTDRASLSHFFFYFQMATHPVTYSKVVELYTIYNSTIGTELIWSLNQGWIQPQRCLCYTKNLNFRINQPDSQSLGMIISSFSLTTMLTPLSKAVLLWLGYNFYVVTKGKNSIVWKLQGSKVEPISLKSDLGIWERVWLFCT